VAGMATLLYSRMKFLDDTRLFGWHFRSNAQRATCVPECRVYNCNPNSIIPMKVAVKAGHLERTKKDVLTPLRRKD